MGYPPPPPSLWPTGRRLDVHGPCVRSTSSDYCRSTGPVMDARQVKGPGVGQRGAREGVSGVKGSASRFLRIGNRCGNSWYLSQ